MCEATIYRRKTFRTRQAKLFHLFYEGNSRFTATTRISSVLETNCLTCAKSDFTVHLISYSNKRY